MQQETVTRTGETFKIRGEKLFTSSIKDCEMSALEALEAAARVGSWGVPSQAKGPEKTLRFSECRSVQSWN